MRLEFASALAAVLAAVTAASLSPSPSLSASSSSSGPKSHAGMDTGLRARTPPLPPPMPPLRFIPPIFVRPDATSRLARAETASVFTAMALCARGARPFAKREIASAGVGGSPPSCPFSPDSVAGAPANTAAAEPAATEPAAGPVAKIAAAEPATAFASAEPSTEPAACTAAIKPAAAEPATGASTEPAANLAAGFEKKIEKRGCARSLVAEGRWSERLERHCLTKFRKFSDRWRVVAS
mmetsp:Transcript_1146/g.3025  ORF Transcript_1146/g.3025 Transcript_1146/m.3025 type:complete len:239 (+) Transcript_1146:2135-2851(+)